MKSSIIYISIFWTIIIILSASFTNSILAQSDNIVCNSTYTGQEEICGRLSISLKPGFIGQSGCDLKLYIDPTINYNPTTGSEIIESTPSSSQNYIIKTIIMDNGMTSITQLNQTPHTQSIKYSDGLGRPIQTVITKGSPNKKDIVQPYSYDDWGRIDKKYLPYVSTNSDGSFNSNACSEAVSYYTQGTALGHEADTKPYSTITYDGSPLNRKISITGIGENWDQNPVTYNYNTNTTTINHWKVTDAAGTIVTMQYAVGTLYVNETIDEDGKIQKTYTDKLGQTIRVENTDDASEILRTAFVYDDLGLLRCIVPPKSTDAMPVGELCFYYNYDEKHRVIEERKPGADWSHYVYDKRNRLAMSQDGNMSNTIVSGDKKEWKYILYDALNRPVVTGIIETSDTKATIQNNYNNHNSYNLYETFTSITTELVGYSGNSVPTQYQPDFTSVHSIFWYDYNNHFGNNDPYYGFPSVPQGGSTSSTYSTDTKGLLIGSMDIVDNPQSDMSSILLSKNYYDDKQRIICTVSDNHMGGMNKEFFAYNFNNQVTEHISTHTSTTQSEIVLINKYEYDHQGRIVNEKTKIDDQPFITSKSIKYNELGEVTNTYLHGSETGQNFNQDIDSYYNIRGWLKRVNIPSDLGLDLFAFELNYEEPYTNGNISVSPTYNGNISQMRWNSVNDIQRGYGFTYDKLDRLTSAIYADGNSYSSSAGYFNTSYSYDKNGNITHLIRKNNNTETHDLTYWYNKSGKSNKLRKLTNNNARAVSKLGGLIIIEIPYLYDHNGNMIHDPEKIMDVYYNHLNLTREIKVGPLDYITYYYTNSGKKIRKEVTTSSTPDDYKMDYCGKFIYKDDELISIFTSTGKIVPINFENDMLWQYEYNMNDHLGNVRLIFAAHDNGQPEVLQQTSYYPYGMVLQQQNFQSNTDANKYLFGGKELQNDAIAGVNIDLYDFGARMYDAELCRWHVIDPMAVLAPNITPYRYGFNNPIRFTDPNGMWEDYGDYGDDYGYGYDDDDGRWGSRREARQAAHDAGHSTGLFGDCMMDQDEDGEWYWNFDDEYIIRQIDEELQQSFGDVEFVGKVDTDLIMEALAADLSKETEREQYEQMRDEIYAINEELYGQNWLERTLERGDELIKPASQVVVKVFIPTAIIDASKTFSTGVDINNNPQTGFVNRYLSPTLTIFGACAVLTPASLTNDAIITIKEASRFNDVYTAVEELF